jgi:hypothetical protein
MLRIAPFGPTPVQQPGVSPRSFVTALTASFTALTEGLGASRRYRQLRSNGASHDPAIRDAFGVGSAHSQPIHFAGRM